MSLRERYFRAKGTIGTDKTRAAVGGWSGETHRHPQRSFLAHTSPTLTFALFYDSPLNVPQESSCNDELKENGGCQRRWLVGEAAARQAFGALQRILNTALC